MITIKPIILWTDALLGLLLVTGLIFGWFVRRRPHLRAPWQRVVQSRTGISSLIVLTFFLGIGLLDSVHFRPAVETGHSGSRAYGVEVLSLLDSLVGSLRQRPEKTYSAPLATHLYAKETIELGGGRQGRSFPRLVYGGAHLKEPEQDKTADIVFTGVAGLLLAVLLWGVTGSLWLWFLARRHKVDFGTWARIIFRGQSEIPWNTALFTGLALLLLGVPAVVLSAKYHVLGTDKVGQDVFYLALKSIRTGLVIGTLTTLIMLPLAVLLGIMAGYFRGWIDDVIQYAYTTLNSIPAVLLIAAAVLMTQVYMDTHPGLFETVSARADFRLLFLCIILGITSWTGLCRLLRGEALKLREMEYIQAAQAFGVSNFRIILRHILPNVMHIVLISIVMDFSGLVLAEAVLSYVGVGVDPSTISFGTMINSARLEMAREPMVWWSLAAAFSFMFLLV
ncbi:MAG: peptide ABC transporter permease, partial [Desulfobacca sp.]|nr:peptide ABC transporter permease [Desulfobacca sp.]